MDMLLSSFSQTGSNSDHVGLSLTAETTVERQGETAWDEDTEYAQADKPKKETSTSPNNTSEGEAAHNRATALQELLRMDDDLRLWLEHTGYFDIDHRNQILKRARVFKDFDERRMKFLAQLRGDPSGRTMVTPAMTCAEPEVTTRQEKAGEVLNYLRAKRW